MVLYKSHEAEYHHHLVGSNHFSDLMKIKSPWEFLLKITIEILDIFLVFQICNRNCFLLFVPIAIINCDGFMVLNTAINFIVMKMRRLMGIIISQCIILTCMIWFWIARVGKLMLLSDWEMTHHICMLIIDLTVIILHYTY